MVPCPGSIFANVRRSSIGSLESMLWLATGWAINRYLGIWLFDRARVDIDKSYWRKCAISDEYYPQVAWSKCQVFLSLNTMGYSWRNVS